MRVKWLFFLFLLVGAAGCRSEEEEQSVQAQTILYNQSHVSYLEQHGWNIERFASEFKYSPGTLASFTEHVGDLRTKAHFDLLPYADQEVRETGYILRETTHTYNVITAYLIEADGKIIGSYLVFEQQKQDADGAYQTEDRQIEQMVHSGDGLGTTLSGP